VLKGLNIPATIFITTSTFQDKTIWRDNVRKLISNNLIDRFKRYLIQGDKKIHQDINWNDIYRSTKKNHINSKIFDQLLSSFLSDIDLKESFPQEKYIQLHDLKKQNSDLVFIGNHSHNHYRLSSLSIDEQAEEIETARSILTEHDVQSSDVFCIPFGENSSFNQTTINLLSDYKYCGFLMTNQPQFGLQVPNISVNPHNLLYSNRVLLRDNRFPLLM
jgi:peptidoglycan/xylan/chitin deacetylase (PgdA/CDA1 family)